MNPIDVSRADDSITRSDHFMKADTPGSCMSDTLKYNAILLKFKALTGDSHRDKWLYKLLQGIRNNAILARRFLNKELDPVVILTMSPNELKDGLTAEEKTTKEPEESKQLQVSRGLMHDVQYVRIRK
uniref:Uncharacterized protein n=1 Tax=Ananas comosus var. bracteatus TaxID=296719 RepID=A0A6V7PSF1_ANACO|nr:unnamed protein product [Ananas comosus var. bracteatus]